MKGSLLPAVGFLSVDVSLFLLLLSRLVYSPPTLLEKVLHGLPWRRRCCRRRRSKWIWGKVRRSGTTTGLMASIIDCIRTCLAMGDFCYFGLIRIEVERDSRDPKGSLQQKNELAVALYP